MILYALMQKSGIVLIFAAILMYMGDLPKTEPISDVLLANEDIIEPAVRNVSTLFSLDILKRLYNVRQ